MLKRHQWIFGLFLSNLCWAATSSDQQAAARLGFISDPKVPLCRGYYLQPKWRAPLRLGSEIRADNTELTLKSGQSILRGHVTIRQSNQVITADKAKIINQKDKLNSIELSGNITLRQPGRLLTAERASLDLQQHNGTFHHSYYWFAYKVPRQHQKTWRKATGLSAWGYADTIAMEDAKRFTLTDVHYTTCPPGQGGWRLAAKTLSVDAKSGHVSADGVRLQLGNLPILLTPHFSFPLNLERHSGFLIPSASYRNRYGSAFHQPIYFNLKPHYDLTVTPSIYSQRGVALHQEFRYLNKQYHGTIALSFHPYDRKFKDFRTAHPEFGNMGNRRAGLHVKHETTINPHWNSVLEYNGVSDNYYHKDFNASFLDIYDYQLQRQARIDYRGPNQEFTFLFQQYQNLQLLENASHLSVYAQLPRATWSWQHSTTTEFDLGFVAEFAHFEWPSPRLEHPNMNRLIWQPSLAKTWHHGPLTITPSSVITLRDYHMQRTHPGFKTNVQSVIPSYRLDISSLLALRTPIYPIRVEPKLVYQWTPYRDQSQIPLADSAYLPLSFDTLSRRHHFSGFDRIGDNHHLGLGVTTTALHHQTGTPWLTVSVGQLRYLHDRRVNLCYGQSCSNLAMRPPLAFSQTRKFSPVFGQIDYQLNANTQLHIDHAYDFVRRHPEATAIHLNNQIKQHRWQLAYNHYRHNLRINRNEQFFTQSNHQIGVAGALQATDHWRLLGSWSYNLSSRNLQHALFGAKYQSCCYSVQLIAGKSLSGLTQLRKPHYNTDIYCQLTLNGLGTIANRQPSRLIT